MNLRKHPRNVWRFFFGLCTQLMFAQAKSFDFRKYQTSKLCSRIEVFLCLHMSNGTSQTCTTPPTLSETIKKQFWTFKNPEKVKMKFKVLLVLSCAIILEPNLKKHYEAIKARPSRFFKSSLRNKKPEKFEHLAKVLMRWFILSLIRNFFLSRHRSLVASKTNN